MEEEKKKNATDDEASQWECAICFESLRIEQSVVTTCGHLYCWPCLHQWMETFRDKTSPPVCPVCKNMLSEEKIVPIFGRGGGGRSDNDQRGRVAPQRPTPQREEAPQFAHGGGGGINFGMFGFPFPGVMAFGGNVGVGGIGMGWGGGVGGGVGGVGMPQLSPEQRRQQQFLSQIVLFLGIAVMSAIVFS